MAKIFDLDFRKGTLIDSVNGLVGTNSGGVFKQTEKGLTWIGNRDDYIRYDFTFSGNELSYEFWVKPEGILDSICHIINGYSYTNRVYYTASYGLTVALTGNGLSSFSTGLILTKGQWNHCTISFINNGSDLDWEATLNGVKTSGTKTGYNISDITQYLYIGRWDVANYGIIGGIGRMRIFDHILTESERNDLYADFVNSYPQGKLVYPRYNPHMKPTDLSNEDGLVAAYNMIPNGNTLVDISGSSNNITLDSGVTTNVKGIELNGKDGVLSTELNYDDWRSFSIRFYVDPSIIDNQGIYCDSVGSRGLAIKSNGILKYLPANDGGVTHLSTLSLNKGYHTVSLIIDDNDITKVSFWIDGVFSNTETATVNSMRDIINRIGGRSNYPTYINISYIKIIDIKIHNYSLSEQEIKDYHNQFANRIALKEDFSTDGVGNIPTEWQQGTGTYEVKELTTQDSVLKHLDVGTKYLECTSAGTIAIPSKKAYGTWEFDLYHKNTSTSIISFVDNGNVDGSYTHGSYAININTSERLHLIRYGTLSILMFVDNYVTFDVWYRLKITRTTDGEFTVYIKGGGFGDNWTLVDLTGGSGTNPITDNTYSDSEYFVLDLDAGDRIANISIKEGVEQ